MSNEKKLQLLFDYQTIKITCAGERELCITEDGSCWKFSQNQWENITKYLHSCSQHSFKDGVKVIDACSSDTLHLAVTNSGLVFNIPLQVEISPKIKITKVCCGLEHVVGLTDTGSIFTWGNGSRGQLGNDSLNSEENPQLLTCLDGILVTNIAAGGWHSAAITICGDVYTWGWNNFGQLGFPTNKNTEHGSSDTCSLLAVPKCVNYPDHDNVDVKEVSCGTQHTLILLMNGLIYGCGWNKYGQVNPYDKSEYFDGMTLVPVPKNIQTIRQIFCESWNSALFVTYKDHL